MQTNRWILTAYVAESVSVLEFLLMNTTATSIAVVAFFFNLSYMATVVVALVLYCLGFAPPKLRLWVIFFHMCSVFHGLSALYCTWMYYNLTAPPLWVMQFVATYGFMQTMFGWVYQLYIIGLFSSLYPRLTQKNIRLAMVFVFFLHLTMCSSIYYALYKGKLYRDLEWEQIWYHVGVTGYIFLAVVFDLGSFLNILSLLKKLISERRNRDNSKTDKIGRASCRERV